MQRTKGCSELSVTIHHVSTHLMFVDDLLFSGESSLVEWIHIQMIIKYFGEATILCLSEMKFMLVYGDREDPLIRGIIKLFVVESNQFEKVLYTSI